MNFVIYAVQRKRGGKIVGGAFQFTYADRPPQGYKPSPKELAKAEENNRKFLHNIGYDPRYHKLVNVAHYKGLKKLFKSYWYAFKKG